MHQLGYLHLDKGDVELEVDLMVRDFRRLVESVSVGLISSGEGTAQNNLPAESTPVTDSSL